MALMIVVARRGQQRSRVSTFQVFSVATARSPGARLRAWLALTFFWLRDSRRGRAAKRHRDDRPGASICVVGVAGNPELDQRGDHAVVARGGQVVR
jgi:hypothetical protein